MKLPKIITFAVVLSLFSFSNAQQRQYDLSNVQTVDNARSYYNLCCSLLYKDSVSIEDYTEALQRLYALSRWIGMNSMEDYSDVSDYSCKVQVKQSDDLYRLKGLRIQIISIYKVLQAIGWPYGKPIPLRYWRDFENEFSTIFKRTQTGGPLQEIIWYEVNLNNVKFIVFKNTSDTFSYDIKVGCITQKKQKREKELTLMPQQAKVISSTLEPSNHPYMIPHSFEIINKHNAGE